MKEAKETKEEKKSGGPGPAPRDRAFRPLPGGLPSLSPALRNTGLGAAWILGLLVAGIAVWSLTASIREDVLCRAANRALKETGYLLTLEPLAPGSLPANAPRIGAWFALKNGEGSRAVVFTLISGGDFLPCVGVVNAQGGFEDLLPLGAHASRLLSRVPSSVIAAYTRRLGGLP